MKSAEREFFQPYASRALPKSLYGWVPRNAPIGTRVGRVQLAPGFSYKVSGVNQYFNFDSATGWITVRSTVDRERCNGSVDLLLVATPPSIIHVVVIVLDVNDHAPEFPVPFQD
ncbi:hypothetical protein ANCDUO_18837 [Ancylostoma duodenale]|uniref:Cadherin domain-containing protein n=1 Tax=Ancylostoma duodenale TaxID=51022 RepID=A0A0C2FWR7_9BILA|nr:hypothetical protein ANCDUO_18837 [Ancylostoma duodenale]